MYLPVKMVGLVQTPAKAGLILQPVRLWGQPNLTKLDVGQFSGNYLQRKGDEEGN